MKSSFQSQLKINLLKYGVFLFYITPFSGNCQVSSLPIIDSRNNATAPGDYNQELKGSFKFGTSIGINNGDYYYSLLGLRGWVDDSGGSAHEFAFSNDNGVLYRNGYQVSGWSNWRKILIEDKNGLVGIGTNSPKEKLSVNGNIRAHEIKVESTASTWPDYVFTADYQLPSLSDTEQFIKQNGHLPEIPKADDVQANGVSLGEMNKILLKKVEELTLHLIEKEKAINQQNHRISEIEQLLKKENVK